MSFFLRSSTEPVCDRPTTMDCDKMAVSRLSLSLAPGYLPCFDRCGKS